MLRQNIIRRLLYLRNWEFINIFLLPACLYSAIRAQNVKSWQPYAYSIFVICVILTQGVVYWHLKLQTVRKKGTGLPSHFHQSFSFFKWVNLVLLSVYPVLGIFDRTTSFVDFRVSFWSNAIFLFAILEYINYYYYQLSHDNLNDIRYLLLHRKLRKSPINVDLQKIQERFRNQKAG
jgi:hypothetical protein